MVLASFLPAYSRCRFSFTVMKAQPHQYMEDFYISVHNPVRIPLQIRPVVLASFLPAYSRCRFSFTVMKAQPHQYMEDFYISVHNPVRIPLQIRPEY